MSFITIGRNMLTNGTKLRLVLKGKQLEALPAELKPLIANIKDPVVHVGVNGRGAEGSMYGIKVFAKGSKEPVAAAVGRIDYRETEPLLQARAFARKNTGTGDAFRANVQMDTSKAIDLEKMDELVISKKKGETAISAKSDALKADVFLDQNAAEEIVSFAGPVAKAKLAEGRHILAKRFETLRANFAKVMKSMNPLEAKKSVVAQPEESASKVFVGVVDETIKKAPVADIEKYIADNPNLVKAGEKDRILEQVNGMKKELAQLSEKFSKAPTDAERNSIAFRYAELNKAISSNLKYIDNTFN